MTIQTVFNYYLHIYSELLPLWWHLKLDNIFMPVLNSYLTFTLFHYLKINNQTLNNN